MGKVGEMIKKLTLNSLGKRVEVLEKDLAELKAKIRALKIDGASV
jgi:hypothetical protein